MTTCLGKIWSPLEVYDSPEVEYLMQDGETWIPEVRFLQRDETRVTILIRRHDGYYFEMTVPCYKVRVNGYVLEELKSVKNTKWLW